MVFNSLTFLIFAAAFFTLWPFCAPHKRPRWILITVASFIFYGWWDWRYVFLLAGTGLIDYYAAAGMIRWPHRRKLLLWVSITSNIGVLGFFKYWGLFSRTVNAISAYVGGGAHVSSLDIILPIGISFYTFESLSYTIDVYRGTFVPTESLWHFFAFLSFFSRLVAGPIVRAKDLLPQLRDWKRPSSEKVWLAFRLIAVGYFKKNFIADNLAVAVNRAFTSPSVYPSALYWWLAVAMLAIQVYTDFSGYTDIGRGIAELMGYEFPLNFRNPFSLSSSMTDLWNRWHMTLSFWFRDYVYAPLGGGFRRWSWKTYRNTLITMTLIGLWHGAAWNYVIFGFGHGVLLCIERLYNWPRRVRDAIPGGQYLVSFIVFLEFVGVGVWFGARSLAQGLEIWKTMFGPQHWDLASVLELGIVPLTVLAVAIACELTSVFWFTEEVRRREEFQIFETSLVSILIVVSIFLRGPGSTFIYFQF